MSDITIERTEARVIEPPTRVVFFGSVDLPTNVVIGQDVTFSGTGVVSAAGLRTDYQGKVGRQTSVDITGISGLNEREYETPVLTASAERTVAAVDEFLPKAAELIKTSKGIAIKERIAYFLLGGGFTILLLAITNHLN